MRDENKIGKEYLKKNDAVKEVIKREFGNVRYYKLGGKNSKEADYGVINKEDKVLDRITITLGESRKETGKVNSKGKKDKETVYTVNNIYKERPISIGELVGIDKYTLKNEVTLNENRKVTLTVGDGSSSIKDFEGELQSIGVGVKHSGRKWYNKVLGYRSKNKGKMVVASIGYFIVFMVVMSVMFGGVDTEDELIADETSENEVVEDNDNNTEGLTDAESKGDEDEDVEEKEGSVDESDENEGIEEKESNESEESESEDSGEEVDVEEETEKDKTPEEKIRGIVEDTVDADRVSELDIKEYEGSYEVNLTFEARENFTQNMMKSGMKRDMVDITIDLQQSEQDISYLWFVATLPLTDSAGNVSHGQVMSSSFFREAIEELNPDNKVYLYENLDSAASGFSMHPEFREN